MFKKLNEIEIPIIEEDKGGYLEITKDKKVFHKNKSMLKWASKEELDQEKPQYALLPQDDYELVITKAEPQTQKKYKSQEEEEVVNITLDVVGLKDGTEATDKDGKDAKNRKIFFTLRPSSMGFMTDGTPSKSRIFICFATGQELEGEIELGSWEELLGKTIYAEIVEYTTQKNERRNKISRILPPRKR